MAINRMKIKDILSTIKINQRGDYTTTIQSVFFYEGIAHQEGDHPRTNARLIDYDGDAISATIFDNNWNIAKYFDYEDKFVAFISGYRSYYNDKITIQSITPISPNDPEFNELTKIYLNYKQKLRPEEKDKFVFELRGLIDEVKNKYYHKLLTDLLDDTMIAKYREWTAAWERHHAFPGGLLVHTVNVAKKCKAIAEVSEIIDKDLLVTAALLHDIGKVQEYDGFPSKRRLYKGRLLFHPFIGAEMVGLKIAEYKTSHDVSTLEVSDFPENLEIQLKHCILSHHGLPECGAAVKPMLLEAQILHQMDDADAKEEYYKENVYENADFDATMQTDNVKGYYDSFTKEFAYPTMVLTPYKQVPHVFSLEQPYETNESYRYDDIYDDYYDEEEDPPFQ